MESNTNFPTRAKFFLLRIIPTLEGNGIGRRFQLSYSNCTTLDVFHPDDAALRITSGNTSRSRREHTRSTPPLHMDYVYNSSWRGCVLPRHVMRHGRWVSKSWETVEQERRVAEGYTGSSGHQKGERNERSAYN